MPPTFGKNQSGRACESVYDGWTSASGSPSPGMPAAPPRWFSAAPSSLPWVKKRAGITSKLMLPCGAQRNCSPRPPDAFEGATGNETLATAPEIQPAGGSGPSTNVIRATADITTPTDVDAFKFRPNNLRGLGLTATVAVSGYSLLVPQLEILDAAGTVLAAGVGDRPGAGDVTLHLPTAIDGATYYARVTAGSPALSLIQ